MNIFIIVIVVIISLVILNNIFGIFSKKDEHRITAFFKAYVYAHSIDSSGDDVGAKAIEMYNSKLFNMFINDRDLEMIFDTFKDSDIESLTSFVLMYEDIFIFKKSEVEIKENKDERDRLISDIYEKLNMNKYEI